jgi:hypothetical protein
MKYSKKQILSINYSHSFALVKSMACILALLASGQTMAVTYSLSDFTGLTGGTPLTGSFTNAAGSPITVTVNVTGGQLAGPGTTKIGIPFDAPPPQTSNLTISFSQPVSNVKLYVEAVGYNNSGVDEYLHSFKVNGTTLATLPPVTSNGSPVLLNSVTTAGGSGIPPAVLPAYSGGSNDDGGGILAFPGSSVTSIGYTAQEETSAGGGYTLVTQVDFDYTVAAAVSAPIDLVSNKKPETFTTEIKLK